MSASEQPNPADRPLPDSDVPVPKDRADEAISNEDEMIEGGTITLSSQPISWKERHETETAKVLTFALLALFAGSLLVHYISVTFLMLNAQKEAVDVLTNVFDKWLPVISSFVGGAVTFYLTCKKDEDLTYATRIMNGVGCHSHARVAMRLDRARS